MNSREAQFILESCRAGGLDDSDPKIAEALQVMENDPELARWFAASQELDRVILAKLQSVPVPEDLATRIRAGESSSPAGPFQGIRRRSLALAALFAMLLIPAVWFFAGSLSHSKPASFASFRDDMAEFMDHGWDHTFDLSEPEFAKISAWLEAKSTPIKIDVPLTLAASRTYGCKTVAWKGTKATLICFVPAKAGTVVHILVVDRAALIDDPGAAPQTARVGHWNSAIWTRGPKVYLALTAADSAMLQQCL